MIAYEIHVGTPKTHEKRSVPYPERLAPMIEQACAGRGPEGLLFGDGVNHMRNSGGHASAAMTLDTYADLFDDDLDAVATRLNDQMPLVALPSGPQTRYARPQ